MKNRTTGKHVMANTKTGKLKKAHEWFDEARFGLFLHWGLYSILSDEQRQEWVLRDKKLHRPEYNRLAEQFTAARFNPGEWAALARRAGMRYAVLTTRHHDGFCLFKTSTTPFNAAETGAGRDLVAEYVDAFRKEGLRVGLYYSIMSWQHDAIYTGPAADPQGWKRMVDESHAQLRELMGNYGRIDELWYDGGVVPGIQDNGIIAKFWRSRELNAMVRSLQPSILINDRSGLSEDFSTPEQNVNPPSAGRRWEACMTLNKSWGYNIHDREFKDPVTLVKCLIRCARFGGNLLLDIGPRADGTIQTEFVERLESVGGWLEKNGEAIYGSRRCAYTEAEHSPGPTTFCKGRIHIHLFDNPGSVLRVDGTQGAADVKLLASGKHLDSKEAPGGAIDILGVPPDVDFSGGPIVLSLELPREPAMPARLLGGGDSVRITAGAAPVLGADPDHHAPPVTPVISGEALKEVFYRRVSVRETDGDTWCPGWRGWTVYGPRQTGGRLEFALGASVNGVYNLELGLICSVSAVPAVFLDGKCLAAGKFSNPGCPDTFFIPQLILTSGKHCLTLASESPFGIYAVRLSPVWRPVPSELWWAIGPFPTGFGPRKPVDEVRMSMGKVLPPEGEFDQMASYPGVNGTMLGWTRSGSRRGEHSGCGVNFPYRCGTENSGVCYARTVIICPEERRAEILIGCDWWANAWVNRQMAKTVRPPDGIAADGAQFNAWKPRRAVIRLRKGKNELLVKCHPGECANWFSFRISDPGDLEISPDNK